MSQYYEFEEMIRVLRNHDDESRSFFQRNETQMMSIVNILKLSFSFDIDQNEASDTMQIDNPQINIPNVSIVENVFQVTDVFEKTKYRRLKTTETAASRVAELKGLRERERLEGSNTYELPVRFNPVTAASIDSNDPNKKIFRYERYLVAQNPQEYTKKFILKLKTFIRECESFFSIRSVTYKLNKNKIEYAIIFMIKKSSEPTGQGKKHRAHLDDVDMSFSSGKTFLMFLKKQINPAKQRVNKIDFLLIFAKQRTNQIVVQLIAYLKSFEDQGCEPLQNSVRILFFFQVLHESIRKEIDRRDTNNSNRRAVEKAARQIELIEKIFKSHRNKDFKNNPAKKRKHRKNSEEPSTKSNVVNFFDANKNKKKKKKDSKTPPKDLSKIICHNCDEKDHYKNTCSKLKKKKKTKTDRHKFNVDDSLCR